MPKPLVIAHRGDSSTALENSLEAIRCALLMSVDMIEIDIRKSRDNGLYVMHDRLTGRTADRNIDLEGATADRISGVRLNNGEPVPTLADVLGIVDGRCGLNLEIKSAGAGALAARQLAAAGYRGDVLISSFQAAEVAAARRVLPQLEGALIFDVFSGAQVPFYRRKGYPVISLKRKTVQEKLVAACHEKGIRVFVWTVDDEDEMRKFIGWGVDGMYSNRPEALMRVRAAA